MSSKFKRILWGLVNVLVVAGSLVGGWLIYKRADFSRASVSEEAEAPRAKFTLTPDRWYAELGETFFVDVIVDTQNQQVDVLNTVIKYDPEVLGVVSGRGEYIDSVFSDVKKTINAEAGTITVKATMDSGLYYATEIGEHYDYGQVVRIYFKKKVDIAETRVGGIHAQTSTTLFGTGGEEMDEGGGGPPIEKQSAFQNDFYTIIYGS